ncbi:MAG: hypothetical protein U0P30_08180 [Vicinamibacterales bacterium]
MARVLAVTSASSSSRSGRQSSAPRRIAHSRTTPPNARTSPAILQYAGTSTTTSSPGSTSRQVTTKLASDPPFVTRTCSAVAPG